MTDTSKTAVTPAATQPALGLNSQARTTDQIESGPCSLCSSSSALRSVGDSSASPAASTMRAAMASASTAGKAAKPDASSAARAVHSALLSGLEPGSVYAFEVLLVNPVRVADRDELAAWIAGDWKLHRVPHKNGTHVDYRLYHLGRDHAEKFDLAPVQPERLARLKTELAAWQKSVLGSLNGTDYRE